ncbi:MAG: methyltransferase domain-containing protein [Anaerolineales bacterium]|jgi:SAM-dependent methyltransferase|nr:methyltransferase domain-containing protein [Anaerolineales bacterium]
MYSISAKYYDEIYEATGKDYHAEAGIAHKLIQRYKKTKGNTLLDVGCGTGIHVNLLGIHYQVEGLDLEPRMLAIARKNFPKLRFRQGNMIDFNISQKFDIVTCLFSAIGHVKTKMFLQKAIKNMSQHLLSGGVLLLEPWFAPEDWHTGSIYTVTVNKPSLKLVRMSRSSQKGKISIIEFQYLIGTPKGITRGSETLELGLFTQEEYLEAFRRAGLKVKHDPKGLDGRGLYIGMKP